MNEGSTYNVLPRCQRCGEPMSIAGMSEGEGATTTWRYSPCENPSGSGAVGGWTVNTAPSPSDMIGEMTKAGRKIVIRYEFPHDMHVVRALDRPNGKPEIGAAKPTADEAIRSVYAAWRERRNDG